MSNEDLDPKTEVLIRRYLEKWAGFTWKIIGGIVAVILGIGGFSVFTIAKNTARSAIESKITDIEKHKFEMITAIVDARIAQAELKQAQKQANIAINNANNEALELSRKAKNLYGDLEDAENVIKASGKLSGSYKELVSEFLANKEFRESLAKSVERQVHPLPTGSVLPWVGTEQVVPAGWVVCGENGTTNLDGRYLVGAAGFEEIGAQAGSESHTHSVLIKSGWEVDGTDSGPEGADNYTGTNWNHKHVASGDTISAKHMPLSVKVLFLCKK